MAAAIVSNIFFADMPPIYPTDLGKEKAFSPKFLSDPLPTERTNHCQRFLSLCFSNSTTAVSLRACASDNGV